MTCPDCAAAQERADAYRDAGAALAKALVLAVAMIAEDCPDFSADQVLLALYHLLNEPRSGRVRPEDVEVQNLARIKLDAILNQGKPND